MNQSLVNTGRQLAAGLRALLALTLLTGVVYPLVVTGVAQAFLGHRANGSEVEEGGRVVGSSLIGQQHYGLDYFQPRPAAGLSANTVNTQYKLLVSGATNLAANNPKLVQAVERARAEVVRLNSTSGYKVKPSHVPADAVTSSGSGLDPDISPAYALLQAHRVAERNHLPVARVEHLVREQTESRTLGFIGEPWVNVLQLNVALRELTTGH